MATGESGYLAAADGSDGYLNRDGQHRSWNLLGLAQRSSDILIAQIYRFSVADIVARFGERYPGAADHVQDARFGPAYVDGCEWESVCESECGR